MGLFSKFMSWLDDDGDDTSTNEIKFGSYNGTPIVWIPVGFSMEQTPKNIDGRDGPTGDALVTPNVAGVEGRAYITKEPLFDGKFNEYNRMVEREYNIWKTSTLRQYLNGEFYDTCFSDTEKIRIVPCKVRSYSNTKRDAYGELYVDEIETIDHVYLPDDRLRMDENKSLYWTRMTLEKKWFVSEWIAGRQGGLKKETDTREVVATQAFCDHNFCQPVRVDTIRGVRPVIFMINKEWMGML